MSQLVTSVTPHFSSSTSTSSSSVGTPYAPCITLCGCILRWATASSISWCCRPSSTTLTSLSLEITSSFGKLLSQEFLFSFQGHLISLFYCHKRQNTYLILDLQLETIHIPGNLLCCVLDLSNSYTYFIKLLCVFFHCQQSLSNIMHFSKQCKLIITRQ